MIPDNSLNMIPAGQLAHVFNNVPCGLCVYNVAGGKLLPLMHNRAFYRLMGLNREHIEEVKQETRFLGVHPDDLPALWEKIWHVVRTGEEIEYHYRMWNDELEQYRWICVKGSRSRQQDGELWLYCVYTDITDKVQAEQELQDANKQLKDMMEEQTSARREKQRLEQYFQTVLRYLPGGVVVLFHNQEEDIWVPEFISEGFAAMSGMTMDEVQEFYREDGTNGMFPEDIELLQKALEECIAAGGKKTELVYRLRRGKKGFFWAKVGLSMIQTQSGERRVYAMYDDMTQELAERERLRLQYKEMLLSHYSKPGPEVFMAGHCNVSRDEILEVVYYKSLRLQAEAGNTLNDMYREIEGCFENEDERQKFLGIFSRRAMTQAYEDGRTELSHDCFLHFSTEELGRYLRFKVSLVKEPDSGELTAILTVSDVTEQTVTDRILHLLSVTGYNLVSDIDLFSDRYTHIAGSDLHKVEERTGVYSREKAERSRGLGLTWETMESLDLIEPAVMLKRLKQGPYSVTYTTKKTDGEQQTLKLDILPIDLRIGRVCFAVSDISDSVREQQRLLNIIAYTFDLLTLIDVKRNTMLLYNREILEEGSRPFMSDDYSKALDRMSGYDVPGRKKGEYKKYFQLDYVCRHLEKKPQGYDFVLPYQEMDKSLRDKQISVLWGDREHTTVCMVRADVTEMLAAERRSKHALEKALRAAEQASRAKSDFLSSMSHDIRTPMNAITGMTALASANLDDREKVADYLHQITLASNHLLRLINDILDMNKIERAKMTLHKEDIFLPELMERLQAILQPQADKAGLTLEISSGNITHQWFCGDELRISQILINILGNAVKFTPKGGKVSFFTEEIKAEKETNVRYRFTICDTGVGMTENFQQQLFEPFTRDKRTDYVEGSGLGLSIARGLIGLMDGTIAVESQLLKGSTFRVELECGRSRKNGTPAAQSPDTSGQGGEPSLGGRHFLVAEDNAINAEILCELLQLHGAAARVCTDGQQAVQAYMNADPGTYDAVLMDIQMPKMNGCEAAAAIRSADRPDAETIPIIAMTANAFDEDVQASMAAGMNAHIAKPLDLDKVWRTIYGLLK